MVNNIHLLAEHEICHRKCSVEINSYTDNGYMSWKKRYSLRTVTVIYGYGSVTDIECPLSSYSTRSYIHINCSTWKHGKIAKQA